MMKKSRNDLLISIILPYYKKLKFFKKTYKSILNQTYKNFELIIVYDDSDLVELKKIKEIIKNNSKTKIICNKKNLGAGPSRNKGIKLSKGNYISFIDADDLWKKNKLQKQLKFLKKNNYYFVCSNYRKELKKGYLDVSSPKEITYKNLIKNCNIGLSTVIIKKNLVTNKMFPNLKTQEDFAAWLKVMRTCKLSCYSLNEPLVIWRRDNNSLSTDIVQKLKDSYKVFRKHEKFSLFKSIISVLILSINSLKRKRW
jgi:teichuronic acid biosynthesis glycosyltransferase TuaG